MTAMPPDCPVTALGYSLDYATGERIHHFRTPGFDVAKIPTNRVAALVELLFDRHIAVAAELWPPREPPEGAAPEAFDRSRAAGALLNASMEAGYYRPDKNGQNRQATPPGDATHPDGATHPGDSRAAGWHCGNGALQARAVLSLIERNAIRDAEAIEAVSGLVYEAGPDYAARLIADMQVPF
jgi:hypothetical protein